VPLFQATVTEDGSLEERFEGDRAYDKLDSCALGGDVRANDTVLTCTDLSIPQLDSLIRSFAVSFILVSSFKSARLISQVSCAPDYVGLNRVEVEAVAERELGSLNDLARAACRLVGPHGYAVVTLGHEGAILVSNERQSYLKLPTPEGTRSNSHWIGAGDALFGAFAGAIVTGAEHDAALAYGLLVSATFDRRMSTAVGAISDADIYGLLRRSSGWIAL
jgi:sugar/nucleoside kinase (ribokinase family)